MMLIPSNIITKNTHVLLLVSQDEIHDRLIRNEKCVLYKLVIECNILSTDNAKGSSVVNFPIKSFFRNERCYCSCRNYSCSRIYILERVYIYIYIVFVCIHAYIAYIHGGLYKIQYNSGKLVTRDTSRLLVVIMICTRFVNVNALCRLLHLNVRTRVN